MIGKTMAAQAGIRAFLATGEMGTARWLRDIAEDKIASLRASLAALPPPMPFERWPMRGEARRLAPILVLLVLLAPPFGGDPPRPGAGCSTWRILVHGARADVLPDAPSPLRQLAQQEPLPEPCPGAELLPTPEATPPDVRWGCVLAILDRTCCRGQGEACTIAQDLRAREAATRLRFASEYAAWTAANPGEPDAGGDQPVAWQTWLLVAVVLALTIAAWVQRVHRG